MEKLAGNYTLVSPDISGKLFLRSDGYRVEMFIGDTFLESTWSADSTHLTLGEDRTAYTWDGTHLSFLVPTPDGGVLRLNWRKD